MNFSLYRLTENYVSAFRELSASDIDEQAVIDTLEGLQGEVRLKAANVGAYLLNLEAFISQQEEAEKRLRISRQRNARRAEKIRAYLIDCAQKADLSEIAAIDGSFVMHLKTGPESVVIEDGAILPDEFYRVSIKKEPDKAAIKQALKEGATLKGAQLERKIFLSVT